MGIPCIFYGGVNDYFSGKLGGVQFLMGDPDRGMTMIDAGMPPDDFQRFFGFPQKPKAFAMLNILQRRKLIPPLLNFYRHDYESYRGNKKMGESPVKRIFFTHCHHDHMALLGAIRHDLEKQMHWKGKQVMLPWQLIGGMTNNQFLGHSGQLYLTNDTDGKLKFASGLEALLSNNIKTFDHGDVLESGDFKFHVFEIDHSIPGSCSFIIETPIGNYAWTGDIRQRGRFPERSERFWQACQQYQIKGIFCEGSLLHFEHEGTEKDVKEAVIDLSKNKDLILFTSPPRDLDRITSFYEAAKHTKRMLLVPPALALYLKNMDGIDGYPRLSNKYLGVWMPPKNKDALDRDETLAELVENDYFKYERPFLGKSAWKKFDAEEEKGGHESKIQRVRLKEVADNLDQFMMFLPEASMPETLEKLNPEMDPQKSRLKNSRYLRSVPAGWTPGMQEDEDRVRENLDVHGMYEGPQPDVMLFRKTGQTVLKKFYQVHVTGHMNHRETRERLSRFGSEVICYPFHCSNPGDFREDVAKHMKVVTPEVSKMFYLE